MQKITTERHYTETGSAVQTAAPVPSFPDFAALAAGFRSAGLSPRWVLADESKRPVQRGWPDLWPSDEEVRAHLERGGIVGLEPWSVRSAVADVDREPERAEEALREAGLVPWATVCTARSGGAHHYLRTPRPERNGSWALGDLRGRRGYCVLHRPAALAAQIPNHGTAPVAPIRALRLWGDPIPESGAEVGAAVRPPPILGGEGTIPVGRRNNWLYRRLICAPRGYSLAVAAATWNRERLAVRLPPEEIAATVRSAEAARAILAERGLLNLKQVERGRRGGKQSSGVNGGKRSGEVRWTRSEQRNDAIRAARAAEPGITGPVLAVRFGCSLRTVRVALAGK